MTTAEREDQARAIIEEYWDDPILTETLAPYYANIIREFDDSERIILRGMIQGAFEYSDKLESMDQE